VGRRTRRHPACQVLLHEWMFVAQGDELSVVRSKGACPASVARACVRAQDGRVPFLDECAELATSLPRPESIAPHVCGSGILERELRRRLFTS
jgi:hypothetical protein